MDLIWLAAFMVFDRGVKFGEKVFGPKTEFYKKYSSLSASADADKEEIELVRRSGELKLLRTNELYATQKRIDALNKKRAQHK